METLTLRVKDIDFSRNDILVRNIKGQKDRHTVLSESLKDELRKHLESVRKLHATLPDALSVKYPNADRSWSWQWVFRRRLDISTGRFVPSDVTMFTSPSFKKR